jgi:iron complex outermembrane recepter protein
VKRQQRAALLLCSASTLVLPSLAQEANPGARPESVTITGVRQAYRGEFNRLETPQAEQTLHAEVLRAAGATTLDQALDLSASVARQNNFGGLWNAFSVRGFAGDINLPSGFLVNGFNAGRGFGGPRDLVGIQSVEVLKGPRSALFGRGEPGGTVNLVTKRPEFTSGGQVRGTVGSWNQYRVEGDYQSTLGADGSLGYRLVGFFEDSESFRKTVETERFGLYPSFTAKLGQDTRATYELEVTQQKIPFDRGVAYTPLSGFTPRENFVGEPGDGPIETKVLGHQFELQHDLSRNWSLLTGVGFRETSLVGGASETHFFGRQTLFLDGRTLSRFFRFRDFESDYLVARAELAGRFNTGSLRHRLIVGADFDRFENRQVIWRFRPSLPTGTNGTNIGALDPARFLLLDVFNPVYGRYPSALALATPNTNREEVLTGYGVYLQDQIDLTPQLQVRVGGRFDDFEQDLTDLLAATPRTVTTNDQRFSPQVGAVYKLSDSLSAYTTYGEGFRQQTGSDFQGNQLAPNITKSAEAGIKASLGSYLKGATGTVSVAAFEIKQSNILVNDDRPGVTGFFLFAAGKARSQGVELDVDLATDKGLGVWLSYAYTDAKFTSTNRDPDFGAQILPGEPMINSPKHQLSLLASQAFSVAGLPTKLGGGFLHVGKRLGYVANNFYLPSYTTARLFGEITPFKGLSLRLDVDNLFDKVYYTNSFADVWVQPGAPRNFRLSATYSF